MHEHKDHRTYDVKALVATVLISMFGAGLLSGALVYAIKQDEIDELEREHLEEIEAVQSEQADLEDSILDTLEDGSDETDNSGADAVDTEVQVGGDSVEASVTVQE